MNPKFRAELAAQAREFCLPKYDELPDDGLYLEQTTKYISELLRPLQENAITASMISNYVKKDLVNNPIRKQYFRDQIAHLIFIAAAKLVLSMDDLRLLVQLQKTSYSDRVAYEYFRQELENALQYIFGAKGTFDNVGVENTIEKQLLRSAIFAVANKVFLEKSLALLEKYGTPADQEGCFFSRKQT